MKIIRIPDKVIFDALEKECIKDYMTEYRRDYSFDPLQPYLEYVDNTDEFECSKVRVDDQYVDGIRIYGAKTNGHQRDAYIDFDTIQKRVIKKKYKVT